MSSNRSRHLLIALSGALAAAALVLAVPAAQAWHRHKPYCHNGKVAKHVWIHVRRHGRRHRIHVWKCVEAKSSGGGLASRGPEPAPSLFGIDTGTYDSNSADYGKDVPAARALGARWDHFVLGPETGTGNWRSTDYWVDQAISQHMGIVLSFGGVQSACSMSTSNVHACPPTTAADLSAYQSYVISVLSRYHNLVDYYESWVEPNHGSQWGGTANPAQYAALLKAQHQAFQTFNSEHPDSGPGGSEMKLLFGAANGFTATQPSVTRPDSTGDMAVLPFVHQVLDDLGGAKAFDGVALHGYRYPPSAGPNDPAQDYVGTLSYPDQGCFPTSYGSCNLTWSQELEAVEQEFTSHGYGQPPMWLTEFGWPGGGDCSSIQPGYCLSLAVQDADLRAAYADLLKLPFVQGALWFNVRDYEPGVASPDPQFFYHYGLLNYDYSHKPAADDFTALAAANPNR